MSAGNGQHPLALAVALITGMVPACRPAVQHVSAQEEIRPVPSHAEPHHRLVYHNALVRVLDVRIPAGATVRYHVHADRMVGVSIRDARTRFQLLGKPLGPVEEAGPVPSVWDNWDDALPLTHRGANIDSVPIHYVVAERVGSSGVDCVPLPDTGTRRLVKRGPMAMIYEIRLPPLTDSALHVHTCPGLTVITTPGTLVEEGMTPAASGGEGMGRWGWRSPGHRHTLLNASSTAITLYEIDWR